MSRKTIEKTKDYLIHKIEKYKGLDIVWYGGEPLLGIDIIEEIYNSILPHIDSEFFYYSSIITNGYLLDNNMIKRLRKIRVSNIQITLDGDRESHNKRRFLNNGDGTFDKIVENIKNAANYFHITVRVNVDETNPNVGNKVLEMLSDINNVHIYLAPVDNINENYKNEICFDIEDFSNIEKDFILKQQIAGIPKMNIGCVATRYDGVVIDALGDFYKCWNHVGNNDLDIGSLDDGFYFNSVYDDFIFDNGLDLKCKECEVLPLCYGGCADHRIRRNDTKCLALKYNIKERIKLYSLKQLEELEA